MQRTDQEINYLLQRIYVHNYIAMYFMHTVVPHMHGVGCVVYAFMLLRQLQIIGPASFFVQICMHKSIGTNCISISEKCVHIIHIK